jgi:Flp pilus assembly protein TadD
MAKYRARQRKGTPSDARRLVFEAALLDGILSSPEQIAQAEALYVRAVSLDPRCAPAWCNLGTLAHRRGDVTTAVESWRRAHRLDPALAPAAHNLAQWAIENGDAPYAVEVLSGALRACPDFPDAHVLLARALTMMGDHEGADRHRLRYLALAPSGARAQEVRAALARSPGHASPARAETRSPVTPIQTRRRPNPEGT